MQHTLIDIVEMDVLQTLLDSFFDATGTASAILDRKGNVLVTTGWQDICSKFHRVHPDAACRCLESDNRLASQLNAEEKYNVYKCQNGLVDIAVPIMVAGCHVGNMITGQFFFSPPDEEFFRERATKFGFDEAAYLSALERVPVFSEDQIKKTIDFLGRLAGVIGEMGLAKIRVDDELSHRKLWENEREEQGALYRSVIATAHDGFWATDCSGQIVEANDAYVRRSGYSRNELLNMHVSQLDVIDSEAEVASRVERVIQSGSEFFLTQHRAKTGEVWDVEASLSFSPTNGGQFFCFFRDVSERKRTEMEIKASEERFRALFDYAPYAINIKDQDGRILRMNPEMRKWHGLSEEAVDLLKITDIIEGPLGEWVSGKDREVLERGVSISYQQEVTKYDGTTFPALILKFPIQDDEGTVAFVGSMATDISDRVAAEEALKASESQLRAIMDNTPAAISLKGPDGRFMAANRYTLARYGLPAEAFVGKTSEDVDGPEIAREVEEQERLVRESGTAKSFEVTRTLHGTEKRTLLIVRFPVQDEKSQYLGIGSVHFDITDHKQAEKALRESDEIFSQFMKHSPIYVFFKDENIRSIRLSQNFENMLGRPIGELLGKTMDDIFPSDFAKSIIADDRRVLNEGKSITIEEELGGRLFETTKFPISLDGQPKYLAGFTVDITERRAMERQLLQAQKMEVVGQLTGGVAHDFNNLLQVVQGNLELAKNSITEGSEAEKLVNGALRAGHRGAKLTRQLLAFSRKQTLNPENLDVHSLVDGMTNLLARTLGEDISIETKFADGAANVIVDENGLTNALLNLALNARAAMPKGGILTVAVRKQHFDTDMPIENEILPAGDYIEIAVTDTGCGMSGENLSHAFEPFFTTKEVGDGSGLGLSMLYGFARQSGGNATIESELGKGTTVRLELPAAVGDIVSTSDVQTARENAQHAIKVLLVEDDADVRDSTVILLKSLGCEVVEAETAAPVPDILRQDDSIDLLLSDVVLPGGQNGIELAQEAVHLHPSLKVILVSGHAEGTLKEAGLKGAGFPLLSKPYTIDALSDALGSAMAQ